MSARPPFGVLVLGSLAIAIAIVRLLIGIQLLGVVIFGAAPSGSGVGLSGILAIVVGVVFLAVGWALWTMRPWALIFTMIMAVFGLVDAVFVLLSTGNLAYGLAAAAIPALLLWYCNRKDIQEVFEQSA